MLDSPTLLIHEPCPPRLTRDQVRGIFPCANSGQIDWLLAQVACCESGESVAQLVGQLSAEVWGCDAEEVERDVERVLSFRA